MGKPTGFMETRRVEPPRREIEERLGDFRDVDAKLSLPVLEEQASRCMDCGIPFCHKGCPLGNHIPDWNDLVHRERYREAIDRLHATNNFPEFTGATCPAPCEDACVLELQGAPVTIKHIEKMIADHAWSAGWVEPEKPRRKTGQSVGVVGSGPAGLAAAQQLRRAGHDVVVYERDDRAGGLLRYGIPDFKLEKGAVDRRIAQLAAEGVVFRTGVDVGTDITGDELRARHQAIILAMGALAPRPLEVPGSDLGGVVLAMEYLTDQNRVTAGDYAAPRIDARGKRVVILGGGDTGSDCLGTALRQGAREVHTYHYKPAPPSERSPDRPWPWTPILLQESSSHEEGGMRDFNLLTKGFEGDGRVERMRVAEVEWRGEGEVLQMREVPGRERVRAVDLVLVAIGFVGTDPNPLHSQLGLVGPITHLPRVSTDDRFRTRAPGVFSCGDVRRGASLVVWAIWEGREAARAVDLYLMSETTLPTSPNPLPL